MNQPQPAPPSNTYKSITALQAVLPISTLGLFPVSSQGAQNSPIDQFITNTNAINIIYLPTSINMSPELGTLALLGYMSAVESFFRALIRGLINIDTHSRLIAEPLPLTFGAALHHHPSLLPEALLEDMSFAGMRNIETTLREIIGIIGQFPGDVSVVMSEYKKICEIRHCCVHRFGRLGANNAIRLGLSEHSKALEKPFSPTKDNMQEIADLLRTFVKTINNYVFHSVLDRSCAISAYDNRKMYDDWHWNYVKDKKRFNSYYDLFHSKLDNPPSPSAKDVYDSFRASVQFFRG